MRDGQHGEPNAGRATPVPWLKLGITHPYPNLPIRGCRSPPVSPPVRRQRTGCTNGRAARMVRPASWTLGARSTGLSARLRNAPPAPTAAKVARRKYLPITVVWPISRRLHRSFRSPAYDMNCE